MVVGETEILGQIKQAYQAALAAGTTGNYANRSMQHVFRIAKLVRSQSQINAGPSSVGAAGVQMARQIMGGLAGKRVLIVGAGEVARSTAKSLQSRGAQGIFVANRSYERACELAGQVGGEVIRFSEWVPYLESIDIIIVSTASPVYVVRYEAIASVQGRRQFKPLLFVDLSVPRNVDPACEQIEGVHLCDIDALEGMAMQTRQSRAAEIASCEQMVQDWVNEWEQSLLCPARGNFSSN